MTTNTTRLREAKALLAKAKALGPVRDRYVHLGLRRQAQETVDLIDRLEADATILVREVVDNQRATHR